MGNHRLRKLDGSLKHQRNSRSAPPKLRGLRLESLEDRLNLAVGLVAAYAFNEGTGTSIADASGTGNVGTAASTTWSTAGKYGNALSFNGTSSLVTVANSASLALTSGATLEAWVRPTTVSSAWRDVIYKANDNYYLEATSSNGSRPAGGAIVGSSNLEAYGTAALTANAWAHLAMTYDGATMRLYVNGAQVSSTARTGTIATSTNALTIGGDTIFNQRFSGLIDEVRVYNRALAVAEIQTDMNTPIGATSTSISINNVTANEGNAATTPFVFTVSLSAASTQQVTVAYATSNGTAAAGSDYQSATATLTFASGVTSQLVTVQVSGDTTSEANETFAVNLSGATNATIATATGTGTILNDDAAIPSLSITNVTANEGNSGTTPFVFTVNLSPASTQQVTVAYATSNGSATAGSDYQSATATLTFVSGVTSQPVTVLVSGDVVNEANETFTVTLSGATNAAIGTATGTGTIVNDDGVLPSVSITSPTAGATVSHVVQIAATANANAGVTGVEFFADGVSLGIDTTAPYTMGWNSTTAANATHTLTAVARDGAGNQATSAPVSVTSMNPAFVNETVVPGITSATTMVFLPDGRMLVGELVNKIWVVQPGANQQDPTPFLSLDYSFQFGEQGLMDIALDPNFATNGFYYVFYTKGFSGQHNRDTLSRFTASGNSTVAGSELQLYQDNTDANSEHHGGAIAFGNDGKIYFTTGEHFSPQFSQDLTSPRGKVLRINPDGTIPTDNPFYDGAGPNYDAIWAYGLRNPYRMSIDSVTGKMYIGDVGGNDPNTAWEEVNVGARGANYGWPLGEGNSGVPGTTAPIYTYPHNGRDSSITGGFVYRGSQFPSEYVGSYFFADYTQKKIQRLTFDGSGNVTGVVNFWPANGASDVAAVGDPVKLIQGPDGALYYVDIGFNGEHVPNDAAIRRIRYSIANQPPVAVANATPTTGLPSLTVNFSSAGSSDPEGATLTFAWTFGDGGTSTLPNPVHTYLNAGHYVAKLTVSDGASSTLASDVIINVGTPPTATIESPTNLTTFRAGDVISYSGSATDPDETLGAGAFSWTILFHHDTHTHPGGGPFTGVTSGTLTIPTSGHDFEDMTYYEIILTVTDSTGLTNSTSVLVYPEKVNAAFDSIPTGLTLIIDGISKVTPFVLDDVINFQHTINAPAQVFGGSSYGFVSWSDAGAQTHGIVTPEVNQNYVATFQVVQPSGLVAAYGFNEGTGTTIGDASGKGNVGTAASTTWSTAGKFGNALSFNGTSSLVTIANSASLSLTTAVTLEAWVRPTAVTSKWRDVVYKGNDIYFLEATSTNGSRPAGGAKVGSSNIEAYGTAALAVNTWAHLAMTYDGANLRLYVNGNQVSSSARTGTISTSTNALTIGGDSIYTNQRFAGLIDEVRVYSRALSGAEIQTDMNTPVGTALHLAAPAIANSGIAPLTQADLRPLVDEAMARWQAALNFSEATRRLRDVRVDISDLPQTLLGLSSGNVIYLDGNAAGHGWFLDPTPRDNSEFAPQRSGVPRRGRPTCSR